MLDNLNEIIKVTDVTKALNCSRPYVYQLIENGDLDAWKDTKGKTDPAKVSWHITKSSLLDYIERIKLKKGAP